MIKTMISNLQQRPYPHQPSIDIKVQWEKFSNINAFRKGRPLKRRRQIEPSKAGPWFSTLKIKSEKIRAMPWKIMTRLKVSPGKNVFNKLTTQNTLSLVGRYR